MPLKLSDFFLIVLAYAIGSIPFGYLVVQVKKGIDVRSVGSGNIGATNVWRAVGRSGALLTLFLDAAKGYCAVWFADSYTSHKPSLIAITAIAVLLGHVFPFYLRFRGGKGVATCLGIFLYLAAIPLLCTLGVFIAVVLLWRYVSLGSIVAAAVFPVFYFLVPPSHSSSWWTTMAVCFCSVLIIAKHRENIRRLLDGAEHKFAGFNA
jgi:glycerol-3-phosphate acyltransferase PlsY